MIHQSSTQRATIVIVAIFSISPITQPANSQTKRPDHHAISKLETIKDLIRQRNHKEALTRLNEFKDAERSTSDYHFLRGRAMQELKRNTDALADYTISIFLDKSNVDARINRALTRGALGDINGALKELDEAALIDPENPVIPMNRGVTLAGLNRPQEAIREFDRAIRINHKYTDAYRNRGIVRHYLKDEPGACRDWRQASSYGDEEAYQWVKFYCKNQPPSKGKRGPSRQ